MSNKANIQPLPQLIKQQHTADAMYLALQRLATVEHLIQGNKDDEPSIKILHAAVAELLDLRAAVVAATQMHDEWQAKFGKR